MYEQSAWSLAELFSALDAPEIERAVDKLEESVGEFEAYRPKLTPDITSETFNEILALNETITQDFYRIYGFGNLSFASDTQDQRAQAYMARIGQLAAKSQNRTLFFSIWWKELDNAKAESLIVDAPADLRYWLYEMRLQKPHTLTEAEEKVVNLKNVNGRTAFDQLYDAITNRYTFNMTIDGMEHKLNREQLAVHYRSADPDLRAAAYQELYRVYGHDAPILGQIYQTMMRDWHSEYVDMRNYASPIARRNRLNDIPDAVVDTLLDTMRANVGLFHRYFKLKAQWMGVEKLRRYDLYAPTVKTNKTYTFNDAVHLVLDSFNEFDPNISKLAQRVFADQHYDSENRAGKMGGAFCATLGPALTPWVLQSYQGKPNDVATMAHELGHAVHSMLAEHHSILTQQSCLPLAETASTFGEMLLVDKLLDSDPDPELHRDLLFSQMDDAYATIMRQAYFAMFEVSAHEAIQNGASADDLCELYLQHLHEQFGDSIEISDDFKYEWVAIPHFYGTPFYVYAYAFGQLLALALYKQYKEEGKTMIPRYVELLAAGGSEAPVTILKKAGFDVYSAEFWQGGFDLIAQQLAQLESLPVPV